ncbi:hypothetical protein EDB81DRAFT_898382 [Dactylonectria macrodidyma]|uniref:Prion-inhibition and propagation HeLo domain-containing protein n=1 Tax=Dactylonectria macrodidyma TaxID=307937 RepID=A0A9P9FTL6_9HYPO|nr:hypothetical protein EDB81DRAFT_898382 [Dactylonectria macrodidyma]
MATVVGEVLVAAEVLMKVVEIGQICAAAVKEWQAFSNDAKEIYLKFNHENRKMEALHRVLTDKDKFGLGKPLFELMEPQQQHDVKDILLHLLQLLHCFQTLAHKYNMSGAQAEDSGTKELLESALASQALEDALPDMERRVRWLQTTTGWTKKVRWTAGGKTDAQKLVAGIRDWLVLISEEIDQHFWNLAGLAQNSVGEGTATSPATLDKDLSAGFTRLSLLGDDHDIATLSLNNSMRVRRRVLQLRAERLPTGEAFPSSLLEEASNVQIGPEVQHARFQATVSKDRAISDALVEFRSYQGEAEHVESGMKSLCMMLMEPKHESFRLPCPQGLYHDEAEARYGLLFPLSSLGAKDLNSLWTLEQVISTTERERLPAPLKTPRLEDRFRLALTIATALARFHSVGWYYQGMNSKNICLVENNATVAFDKPFLFGFTKTRSFDEKVSYDDSDLANNVYRHPLRWEPHPRSRHNALYDLYSLGVALLEIGLWRPAAGLLSPTGQADNFDMSAFMTDTYQVQAYLKGWAKKALATNLGSTYQQIVLGLLRAQPESASGGTWQTLPAQKRLMHAIGILQELCESLTLTLDEGISTA